jgi:peptidoglycan hydrolase CwlO-like protein
VQDPALIEQIFLEAVQMTESEGECLEAGRTRLLRQRQQQEAAIQRLVSAIESLAGQVPEAMTECITERQAEVAQLNECFAEVEHEIATGLRR